MTEVKNFGGKKKKTKNKRNLWYTIKFVVFLFFYSKDYQITQSNPGWEVQKNKPEKRKECAQSLIKNTKKPIKSTTNSEAMHHPVKTTWSQERTHSRKEDPHLFSAVDARHYIFLFAFKY